LVSTIAEQPAAAAVRMGCTTAATPLALVVVGAREEDQQVAVAPEESTVRMERILPRVAGRPPAALEAGQVGGVDLGGGLAERVDGGQPARAQHEGDVVSLDAGPLGERGGGSGGGFVRRLVAHGPNSRARDRRSGIYKPVERQSRRRSAAT
jgi:hypothetical protein